MFRKILTPPAHFIAMVISRYKVAPSSIIAISYLTALLTLISFYLAFATTNLNPRWFEAATIGGMVLSALIFEIFQEFLNIKKNGRHAIVLDRYTDLLLFWGTLYVAFKYSYESLLLFNITREYFIYTGAILSAGIFVMDFLSWKRKSSQFIEARSDRLVFFSICLGVGYYLKRFEVAYFIGVLLLIGIIYISIIKSNFKILINAISSTFSYLRGFFSFLYRNIISVRKVSSIKFKKEVSSHNEYVEEETYREEHYQPPGYHFTAVVTNGKSEPVANAEVTLHNLETGESITKYTDNQGRADYSGVEGGHYKVLINAEGFDPEEYERFISMDSGEVFTLSKPYSDLSIVISDKSKATPVPNANVTVKSITDSQVIAVKSSDNLGVAYFEKLEINEYDIIVEASGYERWQRKINLIEENVVAVNLEKESKASLPVNADTSALAESSHEEIEIDALIGESFLIEYEEPKKIRKIMIETIQKHLLDSRDVYIISSQDRINEYKARFGDRVKLIVLTLSDSQGDKEIVRIPITDLEYLKTIFEEMPAGSTLIFENISSLIMNLSFDSVFKFISEAYKYFIEEGLSLICLLNIAENEEHIVKEFRNLFKVVIKEKNGKLFQIKNT